MRNCEVKFDSFSRIDSFESFVLIQKKNKKTEIIILRYRI